jgi:copper transporter 1
MLAVMAYETLMPAAAIVGLGLGFVIFKDTDAEQIRGTVDPVAPAETRLETF